MWPKCETLEKIYNRAARAFLNRNVTLTHELLETGFKSLQTVPFTASVFRKWDILRITFDTMLYTSPPTPSMGISSLNDMLSKTPQGFVDDMYNRSLELFREPEGNASLPSHVLSALVYSSLKTDAPDVGRRMIEDWLVGRADSENLSSSWMSSSSSSPTQDGYDADGSVNGDSPKDGISLGDAGDGYSKILELYCIQVLPKLEQWEYATEFLEYESELDPEARDNLKQSLRSLHAQAIASRLPSSSFSSPFSSTMLSPPSSARRTYSPAPSTSSSSSSLSTTSTHTVVPSTPRAKPPLAASAEVPEEGSAEGSDGTITPRQRPTVRSRSSKGKGKQRSRTPLPSTPPSSGAASAHAHPLNSKSLTPLSLPKTHLNSSPPRRQNLDTFSLIKASLGPYTGQIIRASSANKIASLMVVFLVIPILSLLVRMLRRQRLSAGSRLGGGGTSVDLVRQRLHAVNASTSAVGALSKLLANAWWVIIRVVLDAVKMAGSGLV
ncbi:hypothetical protein BDP27DRAFT_1394613 [Rhodocollybia butyracea]|uniref:Uncharacterized protein n=1 Tax=Rhodocollybia butyracea TaxID=206335 RepID=A0A9P5PAS8_9AGAR|nr:hypothetical protein BDP27DRAFT_1394613 [Rhodocollybia butyracea]